MINIGIYGVTGYAGYELMRWLAIHPLARIVFTTSESNAGKQLGEVFPGPLDTPLLAMDAAPLEAVDLVFLSLPHGVSAVHARQARQQGVRVIDLSADFRFSSAEAYQHWYHQPHPTPELLPVPYGLPELNRTRLHDATLIANPGCYPTSVLLGLAPLLGAGALADAQVIVDAKSGVSGAGRAPKQRTHFVEVNENLVPYDIGTIHRHVGEMQQEAARIAGAAEPQIVFVPHLLPVNRGILSTIYTHVRPEWTLERLQALYRERYANEPFVRVLPAGQLASIGHTTHTNQCALSLTMVEPDLLIVIASIDNLVKGAAGQAIQNMNIMFGLNETTGLR